MDEADLTIYPTVLIDVPLDAKIMQEAIFGPILPILTYRSIDEIARQVDATGKPLAMYVFSDRQEFIDEVLLHSSSGGVTVNGMMLHYAEKNLPFGGCNTSRTCEKIRAAYGERLYTSSVGGLWQALHLGLTDRASASGLIDPLRAY